MTLGSGDEANLWVKPLDIVKVSYGKYDNNTLRGDLCYGSWNWMRPNAWIAGDEGLLMSGNDGTGLLAEITPMEGLYIQALVPITDANVKAGTTYKNLRGGFAYTVPGLVKIKGQYIGKGAASEDVAAVKEVQGTYIKADGTVGNTNSTDYELATGETWLREPVKGSAATTKDGNSDCTLEAEVDVLAVEGLFAGVGFQYNVVKDGDDKDLDTKDWKAEDLADPTKFVDAEVAQKTKMKVAAGVSYQVMPELKVSASGAFFTFYKMAGVKLDPRFQAGLGVDYDLGDGLAANADVRYMSPAKKDGKKDDKFSGDRIAFSVGVKKSVSSNGSIGVAFQGVTNSGNLATVKGVPNDDKEYKNFVWAIPVAIEVSF
jgi:opacity protein-like surface antigen